MKFLKKLFSGLRKSEKKNKESHSAPKDEWTTYKRFKDNDFWLVIVNQGLLQNSQLVSMSWAALEYRFLQRELINGMFPKKELSELYYGLEDKISDEIGRFGGQLAATQTGFGTRLVWFCAPSIALDETLRDATKAFTSFSVEVSQASLSQYKELLPTGLERQWAGNEQILLNIADHGDDGSEPRSIMHWAYGSSPELLGQLAKRLENEGYIVEEQTGDKVMFSRLSVLTKDQCKRETKKLNEICESFDCEYDGWETPVVKLTLH